MTPGMTSSETRSEEHAQTFKSAGNRILDTARTYIELTGKAVVVALVGMTAPASAQAGSGICGTPLADTINQAAPLIVGLLMIGGSILAYILHNASAFPKNPQSVQEIKDWRNRAAFASVTTPLFALVMELFIGFTGTSLATCVDLVPFV